MLIESTATLEQITSQTRQAAILGEFPVDVPSGWLIFYAPRPIYGDIHWNAGGFFAAINPDGDEATKMAKFNAEMDAYQISYFSEEEAYKLGVKRYKERFASNEKILAKVDDPSQRANIVKTFIRTFGESK